MTATPSRPGKGGRKGIPRRVASFLVDYIKTLPTTILYFMQPIVFNQTLYAELTRPEKGKKERK
ncbi:hypothetical protein AZH53_07810 [Methanomicrobiaceae archaeon CYW5]|uniref:hypothetical protein n=1 Tax=Methanovulcanius yangii TaxID=1789227 RepID=UPI0029CA281D|nr:hypothetical protein [Methanovulcanius yangii]MBT8508308.1 hypothetical protein [Methanovulcanius yangii]